ncbi:CHAT domain-containing protein [Microcoleus sp. CAWBG58]|uniref:CHAT domain-containing protein n=1 Tax=Microcoleus sp. CAWBG58 TaxID=2841651 RepID=UPI0025F307E8|nr:CHAT domain-containing protein [Microcoleus sp. CAWBG58]
MASDPSDAARLRLGCELREIREKLQLARHREKFTLESREAVRPGDITQAIYDIEPQIVHFSGHGTSSGELCVENILGMVQTIKPEALASLFELEVERVDCVVLNACYSEIQAKAIVQHIPYVIGMSREIGDKAAITFAVGFYKALGANRNVEQAYQAGCVEIRMEDIPEHLTPVILKKKSVETKPEITRYVLILTATIDEVNQPLAEAIVAHLRKISKDATLTLSRIERGSIRLVLEGSTAGLERLKTLFINGKMTEILGLHIEGIQTLSRNLRNDDILISVGTRKNSTPIIMSQPSRKFNYALWSLIIAGVAAIAAVAVVPDIRCFIGLKSELCVGVVPQKEVELLVLGHNGESLEGVSVRVVAQGPPEPPLRTDSNGYVTVKIASKGTARVFLQKQGYPVQNFTINLANEQNTLRTITLDPSGQPDVKIEPSVPTSTPSFPPTQSPTPTQSPIPTENTDVLLNRKGSLSSLKDKDRYEFTLGNPAIVNLYLEDVDNETWIGLYGEDGNGSPQNYTIRENTATQSKSGKINVSLESGKYFVSIRRKGGDTSYKLQGINYTARSKDLGSLKTGTPSEHKSSLDRENRQQFYRFNLGNPGTVNLELKGVQNETWIGLYNDDGRGLPTSYTITDFTATSSKAGNREAKLTSGNYIILVSRQGGDTPYSLSVSTTAP